MTTLTAPSPTPQVDHAAVARRAAAKNRRRVKSVLFHTVAVVATVVVLYPAAWMLFASMKPNSDIIGNVQLLPDVWTMEHYVSALSGIGGVSFWTFFGNSLLLASLSVVGTVLSSTVAAYAFARISFPGRNVMFAIMIGTLLLPFHVTIIPQYILFNNLGMVNTYIPLLAPKFLAAEAFFIFLMVQFIRGIPRSLDEAARIDGCGHGRTFWRIILPLMRPAIVTSSIFTFIWSWNDFLGPLLYLKDPSLYTMPIALRQYVDQTSVSDYGAQMAMAVLALLPVMIFFVVFQRFLINGVATQGLKG
ncbi:carbohydrate ABC transporter membrane protein 2 (CUT1 family) [Isoptericola sp. CG 20/1183]|uniref:Carbohydrate ABC transporter membrane protein 2 (CUT1 family) n=1 Tax=Isoptericola halotolerans TaxID=300560 RepID=A0ABX5EIQ0_9MICO|nr:MULTISPECIES: carbohydrate ABC transporter permease [Isoptericola]PRZ09551.1 carbohydrate ABC transporter membrane protein 2 (CUT1 family) [Isoptericola sp. CG 20/1183]PRZ10352.1 carbohydrate ABC transporter membrane protein 2 (CUT1 family) [Isoptericola halotolerans]